MTHLHLYQQLGSSWRTSMHVIKELIVANCTLCRGSFSISIQASDNQCGSPMNGMFRADCTDSQTVFSTASLAEVALPHQALRHCRQRCRLR